MKKISITLQDLFELPSAEIYNPDGYIPATSVSIDSRNVKEGSLFIALKGDRFDGHDFVKEAIKKGASAIMINDVKYNEFKNLKLPFITVKNTVEAFGDIAFVWRKKLNTKIIALTGSAGKTTTKEMLSVLLSEKFSVNRTAANNNNNIGVPLTILSTNNSHDILILEIGTNHFGEVAYSAKIAQPDYALITNIGNSHLEFLKNKKGVYKEKIELFNITASNNNFIFINNDDPLLAGSLPEYKKKFSYGFKNKSDVEGRILGFGDYGNPIVEIKFGSKIIKQMIPVYGEQSAKNYLAAFAVAYKLGVGKKEIQSATNKIKAYDKRLNVKEGKNYLIIDDTYNANPESMKYSIELLNKINKYDLKIAVLGDMFELGEESEKQHKNIAKVLLKNKVDKVFTLGKFMKKADEELKSGKIFHKHFRNRDKLKEHLRKLCLIDSVILFKGSRGMRMEEFVKVVDSEVVN